MNIGCQSLVLRQLSLDSCEADPTHFSALRHYYQQTVENLLDEKALVNFPEIKKIDLQTFRDRYGSSAFVCRYLDCVFSTDGFESPAQRDKHESQHHRRYRCGNSSCVGFTIGFSNQNSLKKHNEKYHAAIMEGPSLADSLTAAKEKTQQQSPQGQQRQFPNGENSQIQYQISQALKAQMPPRSGWQAKVPVMERRDLIYNM